MERGSLNPIAIEHGDSASVAGGVAGASRTGQKRKPGRGGAGRACTVLYLYSTYIRLCQVEGYLYQLVSRDDRLVVEIVDCCVLCVSGQDDPGAIYCMLQYISSDIVRLPYRYCSSNVSGC